MVLPLSNAKITVEAYGHRYEFRTQAADIGSTDAGETHFLRTSALLGMTKNLINTKEAPVPAETPVTPESVLTNEQEAGLAAVLASAKQIERQQFVAARAIERVIHDTERGRQIANDEFNMSVLEALHTGLTQEAIEASLLDAGFNQLEERVDSVHMLDTELLYVSEA